MRALKKIRIILGISAMLVVLSAWCAAQYGYPQSSYPQSNYPQSSYPRSNNGSQSNEIVVTQAPVLEYADPHTITIMWRTNVNANSVIRFSTDPNNVESGEMVNLSDSGRVHRVEMRNRFQPGTTYYFQLISQEGDGDSIVSPVFTVQTPPQGSEPIRNQRLERASINNGYNNQYADNDSYYDRDRRSNRDYNDSDRDNDRGNNSSYANNGWRHSNNNEYADNRGNGYGRERLPQSDEPSGSTSTIQITRPPMLQMLSDSVAVITWRTNAPSSSVVRYGTDPNHLTQTAEAPWGETMHTVNVQNLQPGTRYFFQVNSAQAQGTGTATNSTTLSFTTQPQGGRTLYRVEPNQ